MTILAFIFGMLIGAGILAALITDRPLPPYLTTYRKGGR